jgi:hypothetical protein
MRDALDSFVRCPAPRWEREGLERIWPTGAKFDDASTDRVAERLREACQVEQTPARLGPRVAAPSCPQPSTGAPYGTEGRPALQSMELEKRSSPADANASKS